MKIFNKILLYTFAIYLIFGFFLLPFILKSQLVEIISKETNAKIEIESIYFNPLVFKLKISGLHVKTQDDNTLLDLKSLKLDLEPHSLLIGSLHVKDFILENPEVSVVYNSDKTFNFSSIIKTKEKKHTSDEDTALELPRIILDNIAVVDGIVNYEDFTKKSKFDFSLENIGFSLKGIDTKELNTSSAGIRFYSTLEDGGFIDFKSKIVKLKPFVVNGNLSFEASKLYTQWRYMQDSLNLEVADGKLSLYTDYHLNMDDLNSTTIYNLNLVLDSLRVKPKHKHKDVLNLDSFYIKDATIKPLKQSLHVKSIGLESLHVKVAREKDGSIDWMEYIKSNTPSEEKNVEQNSKEKSTPWNLLIEEIALKSAKVSFDDKTISKSVKTLLDDIDIDIKDVNSKQNTKLKYKISARLNSKGYIKSGGSLRHTPLKQEGTFELDGISLREFTPYVQESAFIKLSDGYLNIKSKTSYEKSSKSPDVKVSGSLNLKEVFVNDSRDNTSLVSFNSVGLKSFTLEMFPNRLFIDEVDVDSFYVNAIIDEKKSINFSDLLKEKKVQKKPVKKEEKKEPFAIKIAKVNVSMGSAKFADLSLPIKFKTHIHDLNGAIYSISNDASEVSTVDITGEVNKYGSTKLKGSINSSNPKAYTDLAFNFKNLELNSASGYSASFAGYEIDSGKLSLDLGYKILNSKLLGENSIIINNIKLGKEYKDENTSSLPLGFAIALLEDSEGIIDIDMPVEGDVDKPDFKYGALVFKTFVNLITKAVSAPFRFLGSLLGLDAEELESLNFDAGDVNILPHEREKLDKIAKMMSKRPKINLSISGAYDSELDKKALQREKLITLVVKKSGIKNRQEHKNAMTIDMLEDIYKEFENEDKLEKIEDELEKEYEDQEFERVYLDRLIQECTNMQVVELDELKSIAKARAEGIKNYLVGEKAIGDNRFKLLESLEVQKSEQKSVQTKLEIEVE